MPFPGIPSGSELEKKIDRCVDRVTATGRDKSTAIAICRSSIEGGSSREAMKDRQDAIEQARYRDAGPASTQICGTCKFGSNEERQCSLFDFTYNQNWTCDRWEPNISATRERLQALQAENKRHLSKRKEWLDQARERIALKREISGAVRRDLGRGDFVFPETRSFPIQRPEDVGDAVSSWGRATSVRARGFTFEDFKRRLTRIAKRKGAAFVAALPADWKADNESKGADGSPSDVYAHGPGGLLSPLGLGRRRKETRIGGFLRRRREEMNLSIPEIEGRMPIDGSTIGQIERGDIVTPSMPVLRAFARIYRVPLARLENFLGANAMPRERVARNAITANKQGESHPTPKRTKIGGFLRQRREEMELSLADVGRKMPIDESTVGDIETGKIATPSIPVMRAFARVYRVPFERLRGLLPENAMPLENIAPQGAKEFSVFKDASGRYRWLMVSSSAYRDRDREIVSTKALRNAVAEHDATGERGPLRWWHLPIDIGQADFGMVQGRMLIESGTFANEATGAAVANKANDLEGSLGFRHPINEPSPSGHFEKISIFERSLLRRGKASNLFTSLVVKENGVMSSDKIKEFIELVGAEQAAAFLQDATLTDKSATAAGFAYKSHDDLNALTSDQLLEYSIQMKEHEESEAEREKAAHLNDDDASPSRRRNNDDDDDKRGPAFMRRILKMVESNTAAIKAMQGARKEAPEPDAFGDMDERLKALEEDQPRATQTGYRASQHAPETADDKGAEPENAQKEVLKELVEQNPQAAPFMQAAQSFGNGVQHPYWGAAPPVPGQPVPPPVPAPNK